MNSLLEQIKDYIPYNQQEKIDKEKFINFIKTNDDILTRNNEEGHVTASAWIINQYYDKVLMCYHKIYDSYAWLGGHADGEKDLLSVALKEVKEESGLNNIKILNNNKIFSLEVLPVKEHIKHQKIVKKHVHYNITYLFECDENEKLIINEKENLDLKWFYFNDLKANVKEVNMYNNVYIKLLNKVK